MQMILAGSADLGTILGIFREGFPDSLEWQMNSYKKVWLSHAMNDPSCEIWIGKINGLTVGVLILVKDYRKFLSIRNNSSMKALRILGFLSPRLLIQLPRIMAQRLRVKGGNNFTLSCVLDKNANHGRGLSLEQIVVQEKCRNRGIGSQLIAFAKRRGKEKGFSRISLMVNEKNTAAYQMYLKKGFVSNSFSSPLDRNTKRPLQ